MHPFLTRDTANTLPTFLYESLRTKITSFVQSSISVENSFGPKPAWWKVFHSAEILNCREWLLKYKASNDYV